MGLRRHGHPKVLTVDGFALDTFHVVGGLDGSLTEFFGPLRGWFWDASLGYGNTGGTFTTGGATYWADAAFIARLKFLDLQIDRGPPARQIGCVANDVIHFRQAGSHAPQSAMSNGIARA